MKQDTQGQNISQDEMLELQKLFGTATPPEEKQNVHTFLMKVTKSKDTTKTGYLTEEELGEPKLPLRTVKELSLFARDIADMPYFADYFDKEAEILTSTSLSKKGKLLHLAVTSKTEVADTTGEKPKKENKGWFGRKK